MPDHAACDMLFLHSTCRYQGPHVWELPVDALQAPAVSWERFLHGGRLRHAYSIPASTDMLVDRLDQNVVTYLVRWLPVCSLPCS